MTTLLLYSRQLYTLDDGSVVEVEVKPDVAMLLIELEKGQKARDKKQKAREMSFERAGIDPANIHESQKKPPGNPGKKFRPHERQWEGPPAHKFTWLIGESAILSGPDSLWVDGKCRLCGHLATLPTSACCLNPECLRWGIDHKVECETPMQETYDRPVAAKAAKRRA